LQNITLQYTTRRKLKILAIVIRNFTKILKTINQMLNHTFKYRINKDKLTKRIIHKKIFLSIGSFLIRFFFFSRMFFRGFTKTQFPSKLYKKGNSLYKKGDSILLRQTDSQSTGEITSSCTKRSRKNQLYLDNYRHKLH